MAKVQIVGEVCKSSLHYLTSGKIYDCSEDDNEGDKIVTILDDEGDLTKVLTDQAFYDCAHLGSKAKAVFV